MALWGRFKPSCRVREPFDPLRASCGLQGVIAQPFPEQPHPIDRALVRELGDAPAGFRGAVADDDMGVGVAGILAGLMDRREPGGLALRQFLRKRPHQVRAPIAAELARQGHNDPVDNAGILPVVPLLRVQPCAGGFRIGGKALGQQDGLGALAGDIADMGACGSGRMGGLADARDVQAIDRNGRLRVSPGGLSAGVPQGGGAPLGEMVMSDSTHLAHRVFWAGAPTSRSDV